MSLKRKLLISAVAALFLFLLLGVFLLSNPVLIWYQDRLDGDEDIDSTAWKQFVLADACSATWRPRLAATGYRRFYEKFPRDERRPLALLRWAESLEASGRSADARELYAKVLVEYPELEIRKDAERGMNRIGHVRR